MTHSTSHGPLVLGILLFVLLVQGRVYAADHILDCHSTFSANSSHETLREELASLNVETSTLHEGEGFYEQGTIISGAPDVGPVEVFWKDVQRQQHPKIVRVRGERSAWKTGKDLALGLTLREVELLNGKAFLLQGFGYDRGGTQTSWMNGHLESSSPCQTHVRFSVKQSPDSQKEFDILGEQNFSSAHPKLQQLNPRISEIWLSYRE